MAFALRGEGAGIRAQLYGSVRAAVRLLLRARSRAGRNASGRPVRRAANAWKSGALSGVVGPCGGGIGWEFDSLASAPSGRLGVVAVAGGSAAWHGRGGRDAAVARDVRAPRRPAPPPRRAPFFGGLPARHRRPPRGRCRAPSGPPLGDGSAQPPPRRPVCARRAAPAKPLS